ncbi:hypothetical protein [Polaromonas sp.]|uniref:hypothetical protein n=1 Tax=Polaromonas sp. TaxID=1869339 RepID=UPI003CC6D082
MAYHHRCQKPTLLTLWPDKDQVGDQSIIAKDEIPGQLKNLPERAIFIMLVRTYAQPHAVKLFDF